MSAFTTTLQVWELDDGRKQLVLPLTFQSDELRGRLTVPAGFVTDYASTPIGSWNLFPPDGPWRWAAVLHDGASQGALLTDDGQRIHCVKAVTDALFREALDCEPCVSQTPGWKRWVMYRAVCWWGRGAYGGPGTTV